MKYSMPLLMILFLAGCQKPLSKSVPACCTKPATPAIANQASSPLSATSVYQLPGTWTTAGGDSLSLQQLRGKVQVVAMIFTHCGYACPKIVENMKDIQHQLADRNSVGFVLVTFDMARDSLSRLRAFAKEENLNRHWTILKGTPQLTRQLSMLLDISYAPLPNGDYRHSNIITILDVEGQIAQRLEGLEIDPTAAAAAITKLAQKTDL